MARLGFWWRFGQPEGRPVFFAMSVNDMVFKILVASESLQFKKLAMSRMYKKSCDLVSCGSTQGDSGEEREERDEQMPIMRTNPVKHKTELCKNFSELGRCPYGVKCRFAHGDHELVGARVIKTFKKKNCNGYWQKGYCTYGVRCQFGHDQVQQDTKALLLGMQSTVHGGSEYRSSKLLWLLQGAV